jgi:uncharacterized membrane protein
VTTDVLIWISIIYIAIIVIVRAVVTIAFIRIYDDYPYNNIWEKLLRGFILFITSFWDFAKYGLLILIIAFVFKQCTGESLFENSYKEVEKDMNSLIIFYDEINYGDEDSNKIKVEKYKQTILAYNESKKEKIKKFSRTYITYRKYYDIDVVNMIKELKPGNELELKFSEKTLKLRKKLKKFGLKNFVEAMDIDVIGSINKVKEKLLNRSEYELKNWQEKMTILNKNIAERRNDLHKYLFNENYNENLED